MTPIQQHREAMAQGGFSPYFGYILNGQQVSEEIYLCATMEKNARALAKSLKALQS